MKALVSGVLLLIFVVTATCAEEANEQPDPAEFDDGPLRNPRRQLPEEGSSPSSDPAEFDDGPLRNPLRQLPEDGGSGPSFLGGNKQNSDDQNHAVEPGRSGPTGVGEDGRNGGKENRPPKGNEAEMPSLDREPFIIIKEGETCRVLRVFDVTRDKIRFQVGRISCASREGAENDAKRLCDTMAQTPPLPLRHP